MQRVKNSYLLKLKYKMITLMTEKKLNINKLKSLKYLVIDEKSINFSERIKKPYEI